MNSVNSRCWLQDEALFQFPMLKADGLKGAVVYYDAQQNDSRMNVLLVLTGVCMSSRCPVVVLVVP